MLNVAVLDNPSPFGNPFQFEITFECMEDLPEGRHHHRKVLCLRSKCTTVISPSHYRMLTANARLTKAGFDNVNQKLVISVEVNEVLLHRFVERFYLATYYICQFTV